MPGSRCRSVRVSKSLPYSRTNDTFTNDARSFGRVMISERLWRVLNRRGSPPLTRFAVWVASQECTLDTSRARAEMGYEPRTTRAQGLAALAEKR